MKLRKIEILGFKSFRSRTGVEVGDGLTAVVGPNGCGKSNIVDAIRWAMGSQSPRDLRGRAMEDVIFAGSENHKPTGFAEVSLTFTQDPSQSSLPLEWREQPEIRVTRRLYRTGDSEYEINNNRARLRDIQDIFAGTGVSSRDAYSIIEQGRIGFVVQARPEERRVIIEEAAGITRYRNQRKTAERRLEQTQDNLTRIRDILGEVGRQVESLERQARKAEQHRELSLELERCELTIAAEQWRVATEADSNARAASAAAQAAATEATVSLERAEAALADQRERHETLERLSRNLQEDAYRSRSRCELLASSEAHLRRDLVDARVRVDGIAGRLVADREREQAANAELAALRRTAETLNLERQERAAALTAAEEQLASLRAQTEASLREAEQAERAMTELERTIARAATRADALERERAEAGRRSRDHEEERIAAAEVLERLRDEQEQADAQRAHLSDRLAEEQERAALALERERAAQRDLDAARQAVRTIEAQRRDHDTRKAALEREVNSGTGLGRDTRRALDAGRDGTLSGVLGTVARRLRARPGAEGAVSACLGPWAEALVVETHGDAHAALAWARREQVRLVATVLEDAATGPLNDWCEATAPVPGAIAARLAPCRLVDAFDQPGEPPRVLADRSAEPTRGVYAFDPIRGAAEELIAAQRQLDEARQRDAELDEERDRALDNQHRAEQDLADAGRARAEADESLEELRAMNRAARARLDEAASARARAERELQRAAADAERAALRAAELDADLERTRQAADEARAARDAAIEALEALRERTREVHRVREQHELQVQQVRFEAVSLDERLRSNVESVRTWEQQRDDASRRVAETLDEQEQLADRIEQLERDIEATLDDLEQTRERAAMDDEQAAGAREQLDESSALLRDTEIELADLRRVAADRSRLAVEAESASLRCAEQLALAGVAIVERFGLEPDAAMVAARDLPYSSGLREQARQLRERLARLGAVNPNAIEEFAEASERHLELDRQRADLEAALADIDSAIRKMDRTCRELFAEMFEQVNEGFQRLFPRLFNGGRARLELTDPSDLLTTGVEIVAQPPGKRLQNMSLMSGGEKALTAVALVFAIFELKPSPFCVLDEVDAPLDEANVGRFAQVVRETSDRSQFLIITHNTRTMEAADTLYGVTMEEPGVSRIVGVRLRDGRLDEVPGGAAAPR